MIISIIIFCILAGAVKKFKIISLVVRIYENRNLHEDIKLQRIQDEYYINKKYTISICEETEKIKAEISKLEPWFDNEIKLLEREETRLKQQKYSKLYNNYRRTKIIEYIRNELQKGCIDKTQLLNQYAVEYAHHIETK